MARNDSPVQTPAPPAGEQIHLPGPTALPLVTAIAVTLLVIGTTLSLIISAVGAVLLVGCLVRWIRETRQSISELPEPAADGSAAGAESH